VGGACPAPVSSIFPQRDTMAETWGVGGSVRGFVFGVDGAAGKGIAIVEPAHQVAVAAAGRAERGVGFDARLGQIGQRLTGEGGGVVDVVMMSGPYGIRASR
jgi:hypothetical protein